MLVGWFSGGVSSFIACYLYRNKVDKVVYIDIADQHPDTLRFVKECGQFFPCGIEIIRSDKYKNVDDVISKRQYVNGPGGAPCTTYLKKQVRFKWEQKNIDEPTTYIWGYDAKETKRAERLKNNMPEFDHLFPLIEKNISKEECHALLSSLGIERPAMYEMGYPNNNCIGCVKGGMGYWNKIREDFPEVFALRAKREREIGHSCIKGVFLDELEPGRGRNKPIVASCGPECGMVDLE